MSTKEEFIELLQSTLREGMEGWEEYEGYKVSYEDFPIRHGEKFVILLFCNGIALSDDEMLAIRWHMGAWEINLNTYED